MLGQQLSGELALQDILRAFHNGDYFLAGGKVRRPFGHNLREVLLVFFQETAGLLFLTGFQVVDVVVGQQVADAATHIFADNPFLAFRHGIESYEIDGIEGAVVCLLADVLGHQPIGHAVVGLPFFHQAFAQKDIILV